MKKTIDSMFETGIAQLLCLVLLFVCAFIFAGCSVTKINFKKDADGVCEYRIYHNDHWLKRDTGAMSGGMSQDGKFEVKLESATASPSEEFNRTMQTYTTAFVQLAQIAAAAYNPSASAAVRGESAAAGKVQGVSSQESGVSNTDPSVLTPNPSAACTDGSCTPEVK